MYVQVCKDDIPVDFTQQAIPVKDGVFPTIKEAIFAINTLNTQERYTIHLKRDNQKQVDGTILPAIFDEFIIIPEGMRNLEFRSLKAVIRAVAFKPNSTITIDDNTIFRNVINGISQQQVYGYKFNYGQKMPERSMEWIEFHKRINSKILEARFVNSFTTNAKRCIEPLSYLLGCVNKITSNFQVILLCFYLADYITIIQGILIELDGKSSLKLNKEDVTFYLPQLEGEVYFQELLETMAEAKIRMQSVSMKTEGFIEDLGEAEHVSTAGSAMGYRDFLYKFLELVGENIWVQRQMLARLTDIDIVGESLYMVQLQQIDRLLVEIQVLVDKLSVYVHREEDPALLMEGEDSSEFLVNMAVHMLNGQDSQVFKKALTCFLMEKCPGRVPKVGVLRNDDLVAVLREYMSKCPDADYAVIRFIKNHPGVMLGFSAGCSGLSTLGTLTSTVFTVIRALGGIGQ